MTLGQFIPLAGLLGALIVVPMMLRRLRALPGPTDPGYDPETVTQQRKGYLLIVATWAMFPVLTYFVFNVIAPDQGAMVVL